VPARMLMGSSSISSLEAEQLSLESELRDRVVRFSAELRVDLVARCLGEDGGEELVVSLEPAGWTRNGYRRE
jgi:hypothetical protein